MLGIYAPHDFQVSAKPGDVIARRMRLREDLLRRLVTEEDGTFVETSKWEVHPLEVVLKSEQILEILHKTTAETVLSPATTQHPETAAERDDNEDEDITQQTETRNEETQQQQQRDNGSTTEHQRQSDERQEPPGDMLPLLAADGSEFRIPRGRLAISGSNSESQVAGG